jgi:hypothetical protein
MVSCKSPRYSAGLVSLNHVATTLHGPGFKCECIPSELDGDYPGLEQGIVTGSCVQIPDDEELRGAASIDSHGLRALDAATVSAPR